MMRKVKSKVAGSTYPLVPLSLYLLPIEQLFQPNDADQHCATCVFWLVVTVVGRNSQKKACPLLFHVKKNTYKGQ